MQSLGYTALLLTALAVLPSCLVSKQGVDVAYTLDLLSPPEQDTTTVETATGSKATAPATYGYVNSAPTNATSAPAPSANVGQYTIQPGDTLYAISRRYGLSISRLLEANNMTEQQARTLRPGQVIIVPHP